MLNKVLSFKQHFTEWNSIEHINGGHQTFWSKLTKNRQKVVQKHWYLLHWVYHNERFEYVKINSVNLLYLIIGEVDECIEEKNENKFLTLVSTNKNKEVLTKCTELWDGIKNSIEKINN